MKRALRTITIILIIAFIIIIVLVKKNGPAYENQKMSDFLIKLFFDELTPEYLGALISLLILYMFTFAFGKAYSKLIGDENDLDISNLLSKVASIESQISTNQTLLQSKIETVFKKVEKSIIDVKGSSGAIIKRLDTIQEQIESISHEIRIIQPSRISNELQKGRNDTDFWYFSGGTGTFTKTVTLPQLAKKSRDLGKRIDIELLIINPVEKELCEQYAELRASLRKDDRDGMLWSADYVRTQSYATIILAIVLCSQYRLLNISIGLKNHFSLFRLDISSSKVLVSKEDPGEQAILFDKTTTSYDSYISDFKSTFQQSHVVNIFKKFSPEFRMAELTENHIREVLNQLNLTRNLEDTHVTKTLDILKSYENPYA